MSTTQKLVGNANVDMRIPYSNKKQILSTYERTKKMHYC